MNLTERLLRSSHSILAFALLAALGGIVAYHLLPMNLFPDTSRPMVSVVTEWPGATADDVAREVTHPIEVRLSGIDGVRRISSTSRDQVSAVTAEFEYGVGIETAATEVNTELPRVRGLLPADARDSLIFKITDAARPIMVLAASSAQEGVLSLPQVRRIAENELRNDLLAIPGVAEVEIFGGGVRRVAVELDRDQLAAHSLDVAQVAGALAGSNISRPAGFIYRDRQRLLLTAESLAHTIDDLAAILVPVDGGAHVRVGDLGTVSWDIQDRTSLYLANEKDAVAISLLRGEQGHATEVLDAVEAALPAIESHFPAVRIEVADTQGRLINLSVENMLAALRDAVIMTLVVILLIMGNSRAAMITAISLPFSYLLTFAAIWLLGYDFNMVTLTAVIIAVGLLADDAIVVIENIERRIRSLGESGLTAASNGLSEILLADTAGTVSTVIVLVPIMFIGGYVQTVLRPLTVTLTISLFASLIVSVTIIPRLVPWLLPADAGEPLAFVLQPFERYLLAPTQRFYARFVAWGMAHPVSLLSSFLILFLFSLAQMPLLGRELMPRMDTGIFVVNFEAEPDSSDTEMGSIAAGVEAVIHDVVPSEWLLSTSTVVGAEPGVKSFGAARTLQQGQTTVNVVDRFQRDRSIYEIEEDVRVGVRAIPGMISANVAEFGATPLSSLRGTVDVMLTGPDLAVLDRLANEVVDRLDDVRGLTGTERSWQGGSIRLNLDVDPARARLYGLREDEVVAQVSRMIGGMPAGRLRVAGENPIPVWARLSRRERVEAERLRALPIRVADGSLVPLESVADFRTVGAPSAETHQRLVPTVDVIGYRGNIAVTHLHDNVAAALEGLDVPRGYSLSYEGEVKQLNESFSRLALSLLFGLALLYLMLMVTFRSVIDPIIIMATLPLAIIGAAWAMMIAGKHGALPSFMGLILLMGIVVNNGILLVDFAKQSMREGNDVSQAVLDAVRLRTRPILMTAGASAVGMLPVALEWAVGIERLSPLAVVAIGGLIAGTFLTLVVVPVLFHLIHGSGDPVSGIEPAAQTTPSAP